MTKAAALQKFWEEFGLEAYEENTIPTGDDSPAMPYITYSMATDSFSGGGVMLSAFLWYRSTSWVQINAKAEEISAAIGMGGKVIRCDGGCIWIRRGTPFAQNMGEPDDDTIRRKYINVEAEFLTMN